MQGQFIWLAFFLQGIMAKRPGIYFDRKTNQFVGLTEEIIKDLESAYIGVNVRHELKKMALWLSDKGKDRKGAISFIINWLGRTKPDPAYSIKFDICENEGPLVMILKTYLEELWKHREHLFILNSIQKR
jgi:hypothetical protein